MACFLLISVFIQNEFSYDNYHEKGERIFRVIHHSNKEDYNDTWVWGNAPVGKALKSDFSEVVETVQFSGRSDVLFKYGDRSFQEPNCFYVEPSVFNVFSWPLISGNPKTALEAPYSVVLTESIARKYFGDQDPMGKSIEGLGGRANDGIYTVTGIMKDVPSNSHFDFDFLLSMSSFYQTRPEIFDMWGYVDFYTYFLVSENFDQSVFQAKMPDFLKRNWPAGEDYYYDLSFEPLKDVYLHSAAQRQPGITGSLSNLYIFGIIGIFILIIACINFMNLATARSMERAKEVGIRKVIGADKKGLVYQFLGESLAMVLIAATIGLVVVVLSLPWMREITGKPFFTAIIFNVPTLILYLVTALITGLLAGIYPAFILSGFTPVGVLKGLFRASPKGARIRKGLVVFQFSLSIALIASTAIVYYQLSYMLNKNLGFDREQMVVIDFNFDSQVRGSLEAIKDVFLERPDITSVSASRTVPGAHFPAAGTFIETKEGKMELFEPSLYEVDVDFIPHFGMEMSEGRAYSRDFPADTISSMVINEAAVSYFGYTKPSEIIGKRFEQWGKEGQIIGVVKDFNFLSLHKKVEPLTLRLEPNSSKFLTLKVQTTDMPRALADIENVWKEVAPHRPFLYSFLDESFNLQYESDIRFKYLFSIFSCLAILIACLGLLGLATYSAMQRTKEIGIRKVLGAESFSIVQLLSKEFIKLVLIAIVIATPFSWYAMSKWLSSYAYRVDMNLWTFVLAGVTALLIAVITVSFHAIKSASANPVKSLRTE